MCGCRGGGCGETPLKRGDVLDEFGEFVEGEANDHGMAAGARCADEWRRVRATWCDKAKYLAYCMRWACACASVTAAMDEPLKFPFRQ